MLKNVPKIISPELIKILMEMGHGDEIVIADGNFPAARCAKRLVRLDGHGGKEVLKAVLTLIPLDQYVDKQVMLMKTTKGDSEPTIWAEYTKILEDSKDIFAIDNIERFEFYDRAEKAYAIIATGEDALYANIILKKGVIKN